MTHAVSWSRGVKLGLQHSREIVEKLLNKTDGSNCRRGGLEGRWDSRDCEGDAQPRRKTDQSAPLDVDKQTMLIKEVCAEDGSGDIGNTDGKERESRGRCSLSSGQKS